jgi:hypothetical protein
MSASRRRLIVTVATSLLFPLAVGTGQAAAPGKVKVGVDRTKNVSFSVDGRMIDVTLRPDGATVNPLAAKLAGESIVVACKGASPKRGDVRVGDVETSWPAGQTLLRARLSRDVSDAMQWCLLEQPDGTDVAVTRKLRTPKPTG